jgi:hypothetical protein
MRPETTRARVSSCWPVRARRSESGPPRETSTHATPCRKTPYARRKTRTPRPCGRGAYPEPFGAPVSRAPLEVVRAEPVAKGEECDGPPRAPNVLRGWCKWGDGAVEQAG